MSRVASAVKSAWTWVWSFYKAACIVAAKWRLEYEYRPRARWIDPNAKCVACGAHDPAHPSKIHWEPAVKFKDGTTGAVIHTCGVCGARWGEKPIITSKEWDIPLPTLEGDTAPFIHRPAAQRINGAEQKSFAR